MDFCLWYFNDSLNVFFRKKNYKSQHFNYHLLRLKLFMSSMTTRLKAPGSNIVARPRRAVWRTPTRESGMDPNAVGLANHAKLKVRWSSLGSGSHAWLKVCWSSLGFGSHVWPEILRSSSHVRPNVAMSDPTCLGTIHMFDLTNNRQKWQLYILVVRGEKTKKKCKQLITDINSTIFYLYT